MAEKAVGWLLRSGTFCWQSCTWSTASTGPKLGLIWYSWYKTSFLKYRQRLYSKYKRADSKRWSIVSAPLVMDAFVFWCQISSQNSLKLASICKEKNRRRTIILYYITFWSIKWKTVKFTKMWFTSLLLSCLNKSCCRWGNRDICEDWHFGGQDGGYRW